MYITHMLSPIPLWAAEQYLQRCGDSVAPSDLGCPTPVPVWCAWIRGFSIRPFTSDVNRTAVHLAFPTHAKRADVRYSRSDPCIAHLVGLLSLHTDCADEFAHGTAMTALAHHVFVHATVISILQFGQHRRVCACTKLHTGYRYHACLQLLATRADGIKTLADGVVYHGLHMDHRGRQPRRQNRHAIVFA